MFGVLLNGRETRTMGMRITDRTENCGYAEKWKEGNVDRASSEDVPARVKENKTILNSILNREENWIEHVIVEKEYQGLFLRALWKREEAEGVREQ